MHLRGGIHLAAEGAPDSVHASVGLRRQISGRSAGEFRADLIADSAVIVELKAAHKIEVAHEKQLLNYLKATTLEVGLIFNFGPRSQFRRIIFDNERKTSFKTRSRATSSSH